MGWYPKITPNIPQGLYRVYSHQDTSNDVSFVRKGVIRTRKTSQKYLDTWDEPGAVSEIDAAGCLSFFLRTSLAAMLSSTPPVSLSFWSPAPQFFSDRENQFAHLTKQPARVPIEHASQFLSGDENLDPQKGAGTILDVDNPAATHVVGFKTEQPSIRPLERYIGSWSVIGEWKGEEKAPSVSVSGSISGSDDEAPSDNRRYYYLEVKLGANNGEVVVTPLSKPVGAEKAAERRLEISKIRFFCTAAARGFPQIATQWRVCRTELAVQFRGTGCSSINLGAVL